MQKKGYARRGVKSGQGERFRLWMEEGGEGGVIRTWRVRKAQETKCWASGLRCLGVEGNPTCLCDMSLCSSKH